MRILHLAGYGITLGARGASLLVRGRGEEKAIPTSEVDVVMIATSGVAVTSRAIRLMARVGIELVVLDHRGEPVSILYTSNPTRTTDTRRSQYAAYTNGEAARLAGEFAASKVANQAAHLKRLHQRLKEGVLRTAYEELEGIEAEILEASTKGHIEAVRGAIMRLEARAAREYWGAIARILPEELGFQGRDKDSGDPLNSALNYGYGILYSIAWRALLLAGLDPYAGFLHVDRSGKPVLAFDYVEAWRPVLVDQPIIAEILRGWRPRVEDARLLPEERQKVARLVKERLSKACPGAYRRMTCEEAVKGYALRLASALRRGSSYRCYRWV